MTQKKFRAWDKSLNYYLHGFIVSYDGRVFDTYIDLKTPSERINSIKLAKPIDATLEQWTGLVDKNGKEIFEGDIVSFHNTSSEESVSALVVVYRRGNFVASESERGITNYWLGSTHMENISVIGNIHENKDLLEESEGL